MGCSCVCVVHLFPLTTAVTSTHFDSQNKSFKMFLYTLQTHPDLKQSSWLRLHLVAPATSREQTTLPASGMITVVGRCESLIEGSFTFVREIVSGGLRVAQKELAWGFRKTLSMG